MKPIFVVNPENGTVDKVYKNIGSQAGAGYRPTTKGVSWCKRTQKWLAQIGHNGKRINLGRFENLEDAQAAYAEAAAKYHTHNPKSAKENAPEVSRGVKAINRRWLATAITNGVSV